MRKIVLAVIFGSFLGALPIFGQFFPRDSVRMSVSRQVRNLYRKPNKREAALLEPRLEDRQKYERFLQQPNTGLVKLMPDLGCGENPQVVVVTDVCRQYSMPGSGAAFSFRKRTYRIWRLADLLHKDGIIHAVGARSQGILVALGDVSLDKVTLETRGVDFLTEFKPEIEFEEARGQNREMLKGITRGDFYYRKALRVIERTTYVLRSVAYRGKFYRAIRGVVYNELDYDKRRDVIIAFRIVRQDKTDGSITLLWKELANTKAPKLKVDRDLVNEDF